MLLSFLHISAHADLWAYVDESGITHFAATPVDERYKLFFKGADFSKLNLTADAMADLKTRNASIAAARAGIEVPKRFALLDQSTGYKNVRQHIRAAAKAHQVDYELLKAVIAAESGFDPQAVSPKGAVGLMQLMPPTAARYGVVADKEAHKDRKGQLLPARTAEQKLTDPQININTGTRYLAHLIKLFNGDTELAVAAYNAGEGAVQRAGNKIPNFKETQGYVKTVMGLYTVFKPPQVMAQPNARAVGRASGRVRVELPGGDRRAANSSPVGSGASEAAASLTPVRFTLPAPGAEARDVAQATGG
ncbi:lytic transglycosylase domain-containing protein [Ottowia testudinis]|uniref:lytic transglycosylase domain-containing protein n=1 Tax=Ottowia testudinis TaxID=2816950 RepID=UPI001FB07BAC|nr:lytic transglycosylase domain-containing protein [Ottowia testudinis]